MDPRDKVFVTASALGRALAGPAPPTVLAIRNLDAAAIAGFAASERIAGAVDVSMPGEMAGPGGGTAGSRPWPAIADLQRDARRWGLRQGAAVVVYDHDRCLTAARAWWVLRWAGIADVRLLDGGLTAWQAAGLPIARQSPTPTPGDVTLTAGHKIGRAHV